MKKIVFTVLILQFFFTIANAQWSVQFSGYYQCGFNSIQFLDENTGYSVGQAPSSPNGYIYKTTNGGNNWTNLTLPPSMSNFIYSLNFFNESTGYVCGHFTDIFKTTNGGLNWIAVPAPGFPNQAYNAIKFFNEQTGYLADRDGRVVKTTNAGTGWIHLDTAYAELLDFYFFDENTGFLCDTYRGVYKTTNGCVSWDYQEIFDSTINHFGYSFSKIKFLNFNTGYMVGGRVQPDYGAIFKTTNGGNNWKSIYITPGNRLFSLEIVNNSNIYVGSDQKIIFKSTDNGNSWITQPLSCYWQNTNSIFFVNNTTGFACNGNAILKTTNGGVFINNISTEIPSKYKLFQNYPNPFNPSTIIRYEITPLNPPFAKGGTGSGTRRGEALVTLKVYNLLGKEIATLVNEKQSPGTYEVSFDGRNFSTGIYFYSLEVDGKRIDTKKLLLIK